MWSTKASVPTNQITGSEYMISLIGFHWLMGCWEIILFTREVSAIKTAIIVPPQFVGRMNTNEYKVKRGTAISRGIFVIITLFVKLVLQTLKLSFNYHAFLWKLTENYSDVEFYRAAWYAAFDELSNHFVYLPTNVMGRLLFTTKPAPLFVIVLTQLSEMLFGAISAAQTMMFFVWMTDYYGGDALFYLPLLLNFVGLVFMAVYIQYVEPLNKKKLSSTEDGQLRARLVDITRDVSFPIDRIYVDDNLPEANAYFLRIFGAKMIAVSPGLMRIMNAHSVAAVITHELGHWAHHHDSVLLMFGIATVLSLSYGWSYAYDNPTIYQTFGFKVAPQAMVPVTLWTTNVHALMMGLIKGVGSLVGCRCEYTADKFSVPLGLGPPLKDGLVAIASKAKAYPFHDRWFSAWYHNHPTVLQRIKRFGKAK